ncbi:unnamed protein product [Cyclocybe aegerita]|uniref:RNA helicase n=1 Tax=Cyclocybe aegerita TaxID=1973307 RepID=A0A8S0XN03_CYCAE|nr:unnamed protein product [Cyclocybe aegerita]
MAKKKKTQLKPVARGFATTSLPKKTVHENLADPGGVTDVQPDASVSNETNDDVNRGEIASTATHPNNDHELQSAEELELQSFIEKFQEKTEKEISRTMKSIEVDRRFSQTLPRLDIDPFIRDRIMILALDSLEPTGQKLLDDTEEEKAMPRLAISYGVLRRLGFTEENVEQCLRNVDGVDLENFFDWLYLNSSEDGLSSGALETQVPTTFKLPAGVTVRYNHSPPSTPRLPRERSQSRIRSAPLDLFLSTTPPVPPSGAPTRAGIDATGVEDNRDHSPRSASELPGDEDHIDTTDPTSAYVEVKLREREVSLRPRSQATTEQLRLLRQKLTELSNDYLFDKREADDRYRQEQAKWDKKRLEERLRSALIGHQSPASVSKQLAPLTPARSSPMPKADLFEDSDSDDSSSGMLGILNDPGSTEITVKGVTLLLRDMSIPKQWSGQMPKTLLRDFVSKVDRYAAVSYTALSTHSRAKRASVTISWQTKKRGEWSMDDVACPDDSQAEQYIAVVALHSLTYPLTEGFISPTPASSSNSTSFRLLPVVYRNLWDELESARRKRDDEHNRKVWAKLRSVLGDKVQKNVKPTDKQSKQASTRPLPGASRGVDEGREFFERLSLEFQHRKSAPAYRHMLAQRNGLPIANYRDEILDTLERSQVLVLSGETGCGKSTQVPSFILEDCLSKGKPCKIYCTEPRRISAISLAHRVAFELGDPPNSAGASNSLVGYSIRLESNISRFTRLAFVTNGIALRMLEGGSGQGGRGTAFDEITHIIVDEVHERTIESDFLLIVLKSLVMERPDLKVILMSATLDAEKISTYFGNCRTLHVPGRTFPVNVQFLEDAIEYAKWTVTDSSPYARRLSDKFYKGKNRPEWTEDTQVVDDDEDNGNGSRTTWKPEKRYSPETVLSLNTIDERLIPYELIVRLLEKICYEDVAYQAFSPAILVFMPGLGEIRRLNDMLVEHSHFGSNEFKIYPLHSTLSSESQSAVFDIPPSGVRKIVIATNIAETGITIPDITCVIDTGKHREMRFDEKRQISRLVETFIARSNAAQRRGRAGRVREGLCFHLFTKVSHDTQMAETPLPEMMRLSLSDLALRIKIMKVKLGSSIEDVLSRALDPPMSVNVQRAISMLVEVRALTPSEEITPMGKLLSKLPTDVHLGKFLLISALFRCLDPALTIAATLNSKSPFVVPLGFEQEADRAKNTFRVENSDFLTINNAFASWRRACANPGFGRKFCRTNFLSYQNLQQIEDLRQQFLGYLIDSSFIQVDKSLVRELNSARYSRGRTKFVNVPDELDVNSKNPAIVHAALAAGLYPKVLSIDGKYGELRTITNNQQAFFHPSSVNFGKNAANFDVHHLAYFTLMHSKKLYAWETGPIDDLSLLLLCGECDFKLVADMTSIDRKIKYSLPPKTGVALKILRDQLSSLLAHQYQGKALTSNQRLWKEIGLLALGRTKIVDKDHLKSLLEE